MLITSFDWRRLSALAQIEYRVDANGSIVVRAADGSSDGPPFASAQARDGSGGFAARPLDDVGLVWTPASDDARGFILRTKGTPATMLRARSRWGALATSAALDAEIDERLVLATLGAETRAPIADGDGNVKAPRTERGYPERKGEQDPGDFARDAKDFVESKGAHSSHGIMQTLIATALAVRPDLFEGIDPSEYRTVLWDPQNSMACGAAYLSTFGPTDLADPVRARVHYGSGRVAPEASLWGAHLYDDLVLLDFVALWNDDASIRIAAQPAPEPARVPWRPSRLFWLVVAFACFALSALASFFAARLLKQRAVAA